MPEGNLNPSEGEKPGEPQNPWEGETPGENQSQPEGEKPGENQGPSEGEKPGENQGPSEGETPGENQGPVSYTHLDVYKRQLLRQDKCLVFQFFHPQFYTGYAGLRFIIVTDLGQQAVYFY